MIYESENKEKYEFKLTPIDIVGVKHYNLEIERIDRINRKN